MKGCTSQAQITQSIIFYSISVILLVLCIILSLPFWFKSTQNKKTKALKLVPILISMCFISILIQSLIMPCFFNFNDNTYFILDAIYLVTYGFQLEFLCLIFYFRAKSVFQNTFAHFTNKSIKIFAIVFTLYPIYFIISTFFLRYVFVYIFLYVIM